MDAYTESRDERAKKSDPVPFFVPLMPFENALLSQLQTRIDREKYATYNGERYPVPMVFEEWEWTKSIRKSLMNDLADDSEEFITDYGEDRAVGLKYLLHEFNAYGKGSNVARAKQLSSSNERFLSDLGDRAIEDVVIQAWPEDLACWQTISIMWQHCGQYWNFDGWGHSEGFFIFELIRKFTIQWKRPSNMESIDRTLIRNPQFEMAYNTEWICKDPDPLEDTADDRLRFEFKEFHVTKKPDPKKIPKWDNNMSKTIDGKFTDEILRHRFRVSGREYPIEDPRSYVHYIPWSELTSVTDEELQRSGISLDVPFLDRPTASSWVVWEPPFAGFAWSQHLHSEDEVYQYHVVQNWPLPGHYMSRKPDKVIFGVRQLDKTDFIADLGDYWKAWNDCAITVDDVTGHVLLLETIPGMRYRSRREHQDENATRQYFRNVVEAHANGSLDQPILADLTDIDAMQILQFQNSLRLITEGEISSIDWTNPLGVGQNGRVFKATWRIPRGILVKSSDEKDVLDVVLKEVLPRGLSAEVTLKKFLKELYLTYVSLGANPTGCVRFLGVARLSGTEKEAKCHSSIQKDKLFLVFERATERSFLRFLEDKLETEPFFQSWYTIVDAIACVASGLDTLHKHNVLHRDLHDENVLVTLRKFPHDPKYPFEYCYMLSDIGEGKMLHTSSTNPEEAEGHYASYGNPLYRAPEVTGPSGWTKAADVWAFGIICLKLLEMRRLIDRNCMKTPARVIDAVQEQHPGKNFSRSSGDVGFIVPLSLKRVLEPCFRHDPDERPDVHTVAVGMDDLSLGFFLEDKAKLENNTSVRWTYWNWNETKAAGLKGKGLATSGWNGDLDATLDDMGQLTLDDVPCLD